MGTSRPYSAAKQNAGKGMLRFCQVEMSGRFRSSSIKICKKRWMRCTASALPCLFFMTPKAMSFSAENNTEVFTEAQTDTII